MHYLCIEIRCLVHRHLTIVIPLPSDSREIADRGKLLARVVRVADSDLD